MMSLCRLRQSFSPGLSRSFRLAATVVWMGALVLGMGNLWKYERTPGDVVRSPAEWPTSAHLTALSSGFTLVMVAHPCCPCTRTSIEELARIMAGTPRPTAAYVLFFTPQVLPAGWKKTDLSARAAAIPGVTALADEDGREAARFHATVSGQTLLFDAAGHLQYSGGLTAARGVQGDSPGREAILALLRGQKTDSVRLPVFGCSLLSAR